MEEKWAIRKQMFAFLPYAICDFVVHFVFFYGANIRAALTLLLNQISEQLESA